MKQFEYTKIIKESIEGLSQEELNDYGHYGWEMCGSSKEFIKGDDYNVFYFKREI